MWMHAGVLTLGAFYSRTTAGGGYRGCRRALLRQRRILRCAHALSDVASAGGSKGFDTCLARRFSFGGVVKGIARRRAARFRIGHEERYFQSH